MRAGYGNITFFPLLQQSHHHPPYSQPRSPQQLNPCSLLARMTLQGGRSLLQVARFKSHAVQPWHPNQIVDLGAVQEPTRRTKLAFSSSANGNSRLMMLFSAFCARLWQPSEFSRWAPWIGGLGVSSSWSPSRAISSLSCPASLRGVRILSDGKSWSTSTASRFPRFRVHLSRCRYTQGPHPVRDQRVYHASILTVGLSGRNRRKVVPVVVCTSKPSHVRKRLAPFP